LTPGSEFTFAALWDPKTGFSTLRNGKLVAVSSTPPRPETRPSKLLFDDLDFLDDDDWDGRSPPSHFASINSSKDVEQDDIPNIRISEPEPFEDYPLQLAALCGAPDLDPSVSFSNSKYTSSSEEDEGFFDSYNYHEDCEPHLVSDQHVTSVKGILQKWSASLAFSFLEHYNLYLDIAIPQRRPQFFIHSRRTFVTVSISSST
jgi:hypothetical protein